MKTNTIENYGLYRGLMGNAIFLFCQDSVRKDTVNKKLAKKYINHIIENVPFISDFSFADGLLGIGWGIQWILTQKIIRADADEILEDLDAEIFKLIMYSKSDNVSLDNGAMGRILYIHDRIIYPHSQRNIYQEVPLKELLMLSIDEFYHHLVVVTENGISMKKDVVSLDDNTYLLHLAQALIICLKIQKMFSVRYIYDLHPYLNDFTDKLIQGFSDSNTFIIKPEMKVLINSYEKSLLYFNDQPKLLRLNMYKSAIGDKRIKADTTYNGWFKEISKLSLDSKIQNWKDGWLIS